MSRYHCRARRNEQGSAILIVFIVAAIIAIGLYREFPDVVFEAQRQKEQLLIDRGNEYKHAVKLFVRRFGTYPQSIEALENTNTVRCLRRRYADPFTHQQDWRLIHAGPGGILLDSKVKTNPDGTSSPPDSDVDAADSGSGRVARLQRARPPAIRAKDNAGEAATASDAPADPSAPLLPDGKAARITDNSPANVDPPSTKDSDTGGSAGASGTNFGSGIAGVGSNAHGQSIMLVQKQSDYSLWEFCYNPAVDGDMLPLMPQRTPVEGVNGTSSPGTTAPTSNSDQKDATSN
jgi:type II secretory pathway pseudopilin PulG